ncbi:MAG TPA: lysylphosphatidylglycerol synthase transmembrane domain-containing protein [Gaiellaceae bacterium]
MSSRVPEPRTVVPPLPGAATSQDSPLPGRGRKALLGLALGMAVSAVFLWLAVRDANLASVWRSLNEARASLVALAVVAMAGVYLIQALRWRSIVASPRLGTARFVEMVVSGVACNNVLPARLGDLLRARWLSREARIPSGRAFGTVVLDRGSDLVSLLLLLALGLAAVGNRSTWLMSMAIAAAVGVLALGALILGARVFIRRDAGALRRFGLIGRLVRDAVQLLAEPMGRRRPLGWLVLSLCAWLVWALGAIAVARALGFRLGLTEAIFVTAVMNLGVAIPSAPGFVGSYEWLGVASLRLFGVHQSQALAFAIVLHASWYVPTTLAGGAALGIRAYLRLHRHAWAAGPRSRRLGKATAYERS